jgi:hypothetical protein
MTFVRFSSGCESPAWRFRAFAGHCRDHAVATRTVELTARAIAAPDSPMHVFT